MPEEIKTVTGELFKKEKKESKTGNEYYVLKIGGSSYTLFKPSAEAFDSDASMALAWKVAEGATIGSVLEVRYTEKGTYANIQELMVKERAPAKEAEPSAGSDYWEAKSKREDMRSALHAAVQHAEGKDTKSEDVITVAEAFYKLIREVG